VGRRFTGGAICAGAAVTALTMVGAPWWAVAIAVVVGIAVPGLLALAQTLVPEESEHKRDVLLAWMRHRERQARNRVPAQRRRKARSRQ
jgi:MFS family permease